MSLNTGVANRTDRSRSAWYSRLSRLLPSNRTHGFTGLPGAVLISLLSGLLSLMPATIMAASPTPESMVERARPCTACHGKQGRATADGYFPRIAGKPATYLLNQLRHFRDGRRRYQPMQHLLSGLDDNYLLALAEYFARQDVAYPAPQTRQLNPLERDLALSLIKATSSNAGKPACTGCHGNDLMGDGMSVPPLLGLPRDYLNAQLGAWRNGTRVATAPDCMADIAGRLSAEQISAITYWLSAQSVPSKRVAPGHLAVPPVKPPEIRCGSMVETAMPVSHRSDQTSEPTPNRSSAATEQLAKGQYLARAANCAGCHSAPGSPPYSGGRAIETPFGIVWSGNLTPDAKTGLGQWSADDFWQAMHSGLARDGRALYPAFPYPNYSGITRADSDALFAWLQSLPAVHREPRSNRIRFPFNTGFALWAWRALNFQPTPFSERADRSQSWNRGAYLVEVLGHCSACHGERSSLSGLEPRDSFGGELMPSGDWLSPSLHDVAAAGLQNQSTHDIIQLLQTGHNSTGSMTGPMSRIVITSTQFLTPTDLLAMAEYLRSIPARTGSVANRVPSASSTERGANVYRKHCEACHAADGRGGGNAYPPLAENRTVRSDNPVNAIQMILHGGYQPVTRLNPWPYGMPPFAQELSNREIADVLSYLRSSWGNRVRPISSTEVSRQR